MRAPPPALALALALACGPAEPVDTAATSTSESTSTDSATTSTSTSTTDSSSGSGSGSGATLTTAATTAPDSTTGALDTCDPDPCTADPPDECDGDILHTYGESTCTAHHGIAMCTFDVVDIDCAADGLTCEKGACRGLATPAAGEVIFVELMIDPETLSDFKAEWFELRSLADAPRNLSGCVLADAGVNGDEHIIVTDEPLLIGPGELLVMAKTADPAENGGIEGVAYAFGDAFSLTNTGDTAILRCGDVVIDALTYAPKTWPFDAGVSMSLDPVAWTAEANDFADNWCAAVDTYAPMNLGTPGVDNPPCSP